MDGDLPEDLVIDILSRIPVKSLMRFKCVCKSWRSLFKNPTFIHKHLNSANKDDFLFFKRVDMASQKYAFSLISNDTLDVIENLVVPSHIAEMRMCGLLVVSCCDGIVCAEYHHSNLGDGIFLLNPATKEFKSLPESDVPRPINMCAHPGHVGFGFDAKANDYKVVHLAYFTAYSSDEFHQVEIYNLKTGCWRISDATMPADIIILDDAQTAYIHGMYSWIGIHELYDDDAAIVVSFDMNKEVFITTPLPHHSTDYMTQMMALNEYVALIIHKDPNQWMAGKSEVWVLNEFGVKESWTKLYTIQPHLGSELRWLSGFWKNGHMFVETTSNSQKMVLFNPVTLEIKDLQFDSLSHTWIGSYKESLISIN